MTRENAKANLKFITAFANGETIQYLSFYGDWQDSDEPTFTQEGRYRVKPKRVFALYHPEHNQCKTNLERFSELSIDAMLLEGWVKVELGKCND